MEQFQAHQLAPQGATRPALAVVQVDGGRLQLRGEGDGPGAHDAAWREDKVSMLATAAVQTFTSDPEPDLPEGFRDRKYVEALVRGMGGVGPLSDSDPPAEDPPGAGPTAAEQDGQSRAHHAPELWVRTSVASTCAGDAFGPMVAAEAERRHFRAATHRVFVGDGAAWIWKLQRQYFPGFPAIVDILHVLTPVFAAAQAAASAPAACWALFQTWAEACWQGRVAHVIEQLHALRDEAESLSKAEAKSLPDTDPRTVLLQTLGYLEHNRDRMDYPRYRQEGLPMTSSYVESTVKRFNRRVKGTEKSWGEGGAEAILHLRAAFLSEDDHLERHLRTRPHSPFRTYRTRQNKKAA